MASKIIRHAKFFKYLTIAGASLGVISAGAFAATMGISAGNEDFITDELREYEVKFSSEGSLISEATYKRGEEIVPPEGIPEHEIDGENNYMFIGWDVLGTGIPTPVPTHAYFSFNAKAVYLKTGKFDLSFLDLSKMDPETLMNLLESLNIDWEDFMDLFNIDPETLMDWLMDNPVLSFTADDSRFIAYFRSTSFGDFNYETKKLANPSFYNSKERISPGSINPLCYTADKVNQAYNTLGVLPSTFDFVNYNITYASKQDYYPVPDCEYNEQDTANGVDSDAHYLKTPKNNKYSTRAAYVPAFSDVISLLKTVNYSKTEIGRDEREYQQYALDNYTAVPKEYEKILDNYVDRFNWYEGDYRAVDEVAAFVSNMGDWSQFKDGQVNLNAEKNKDPVEGLIENREGSDLDFNIMAMMIFRRLGIPARIVKGYLPFNGIQQGLNQIYFFNQHYWCEIYINRVGWMICDCTNFSDALGTNPYGEFDKSKNGLVTDTMLDSIEVTPPGKTEYEVGDTLSTMGAKITANYTDGTSKNVPITASNKNIEIDYGDLDPTNLDTPGTYPITVSYTEDGVTKSDTFNITVVEPPVPVSYVEFDFSDVKTTYYLNDTIDTTKIEGIKATAYYEDGSKKDVSDLVKTSGYVNTESVGYYSVSAYIEQGALGKDSDRYQEYFDIYVKEEEIVEITIETLPDKLDYILGEELDPTGIEIGYTKEKGDTGTLDLEKNVRYSVKELPVVSDNYQVTVYYDNPGGRTVYATFEVKVSANIPVKLEYDSIGEINTGQFEVGDTFDPMAFIGDGSLKVTLKKDSLKINKTNAQELLSSGALTFSNVDLGTIGDGFIRATYTQDETSVYVDIPITVSAVDPFNYSLSGKVMTAGPGNIAGTDVFSFTASQPGTYYFARLSYSTYSPTGSWSINNGLINKASSNNFTYDKVSQLYETSNVDITYLTDVTYGLYPSYSNGAEYETFATSDVKHAGDVDSYSTTMFVLDNNVDFQILTNAARGIKYSPEISSAVTTYENNVIGQSQTESNAIYRNASFLGQETLNQISSFAMTYLGTTTVNVSNTTTLINAIKTIKSAFSTFEISNSFKYSDPSKDPVFSCLAERKGVSNDISSAATLVYRYLGIPARYVVGYGAYSDGGATTVTTKAAHSWCEVYVSGIGWIIVDPTGFDTGKKINDEYSGGFSTEGIYNRSKIAFGDIVEVNFDATEFVGEIMDGWYMYYDEKNDHGQTYEDNLDSIVLPSYLELRLELETELTMLGGVNKYVVSPKLKVINLITNEDVTDQYGYILSPENKNLIYYIFPAIIEVTINAKQDAYTMGAGGTITLSMNSDLTYTIDVKNGAFTGTSYLNISGSITFDQVGSSITTYSSDSISIYYYGPNGELYQFYWVISPITINPPEGGSNP